MGDPGGGGLPGTTIIIRPNANSLDWNIDTYAAASYQPNPDTFLLDNSFNSQVISIVAEIDTGGGTTATLNCKSFKAGLIRNAATYELKVATGGGRAVWTYNGVPATYQAIGKPNLYYKLFDSFDPMLPLLGEIQVVAGGGNPIWLYLNVVSVTISLV